MGICARKLIYFGYCKRFLWWLALVRVVFLVGNGLASYVLVVTPDFLPWTSMNSSHVTKTNLPISSSPKSTELCTQNCSDLEAFWPQRRNRCQYFPWYALLTRHFQTICLRNTKDENKNTFYHQVVYGHLVRLVQIKAVSRFLELVCLSKKIKCKKK